MTLLEEGAVEAATAVFEFCSLNGSLDSAEFKNSGNSRKKNIVKEMERGQDGRMIRTGYSERDIGEREEKIR